MQMSLLTMDQILMTLAGSVLFVILVRRLIRRTPWLAGSPLRPNTIREDAVAVAAVGYLLAVLALAGVANAAGLEPEGDLATLLIGVGAQMVGLVVCLLIASRRFSGGVQAFLIGSNTSRSMRHVWLISVITLIAIGLCPLIAEATVAGLTWIDPTFTIPVHPTLLALHEKEVSLWFVMGLWSGAAVVAPLAEELFFRGFMQTMLLGMLDHRWLAIAITSIAFGMVHYPQPHAVPALIFLSLLLGFAYERTGSLMAPVAIHALFNLKTLLWETLGNMPG